MKQYVRVEQATGQTISPAAHTAPSDKVFASVSAKAESMPASMAHGTSGGQAAFSAAQRITTESQMCTEHRVPKHWSGMLVVDVDAEVPVESVVAAAVELATEVVMPTPLPLSRPPQATPSSAIAPSDAGRIAMMVG